MNELLYPKHLKSDLSFLNLVMLRFINEFVAVFNSNLLPYLLDEGETREVLG